MMDNPYRGTQESSPSGDLMLTLRLLGNTVFWLLVSVAIYFMVIF